LVPLAMGLLVFDGVAEGRHCRGFVERNKLKFKLNSF
jgi:hypothetical protein